MVRAAALLLAAGVAAYDVCPADLTHHRRVELSNEVPTVNEWYRFYLGTGRMAKLTCLRADGDVEVRVGYARVASAVAINTCNTTVVSNTPSCTGGAPGLAVGTAYCVATARAGAATNIGPLCQEQFGVQSSSPNCYCLAVGDTNTDGSNSAADIISSKVLTPAKSATAPNQATANAPFWYKAHGTESVNMFVEYRRTSATAVSLSFIAEARQPDDDWCVKSFETDAQVEIDGRSPDLRLDGVADFPRHQGFQFHRGIDGIVGSQSGSTPSGGGAYYYYDLGAGPNIDIDCLHLYSTVAGVPGSATVPSSCLDAQYGHDGQMNPAMDMQTAASVSANGIASVVQENYDVHLVDAFDCNAFTKWTEPEKFPYKLFVKSPNAHQEKVGTFTYTGQTTAGKPVWKRTGDVSNGWLDYYIYLAPTNKWFLAPSTETNGGTDFSHSSGYISSMAESGQWPFDKYQHDRMPHQIFRWQHNQNQNGVCGLESTCQWVEDDDISISSSDGSGFVEWYGNRHNVTSPALAGFQGEEPTCCFQATQYDCGNVEYNDGSKACFWNGQAQTCHNIKTMSTVSLKKGVLGVDNAGFSFTSYAVHGPKSTYVVQESELSQWEGQVNRRWFLRVKNNYGDATSVCPLSLTASFKSNVNGGTCEPGGRQLCDESETKCLLTRLTVTDWTGSPDASDYHLQYWNRWRPKIWETTGNYFTCNCLKEKEICYRKIGCTSTKRYQLILQNCYAMGCGNFCNSGAGLRAGIGSLIAAAVALFVTFQ